MTCMWTCMWHACCENLRITFIMHDCNMHVFNNMHVVVCNMPVTCTTFLVGRSFSSWVWFTIWCWECELHEHRECRGKSIFHQSISIPVVKFSDIVISWMLTNTGDVHCSTQVELWVNSSITPMLATLHWCQHHNVNPPLLLVHIPHYLQWTHCFSWICPGIHIYCLPCWSHRKDCSVNTGVCTYQNKNCFY